MPRHIAGMYRSQNRIANIPPRIAICIANTIAPHTTLDRASVPSDSGVQRIASESPHMESTERWTNSTPTVSAAHASGHDHATVSPEYQPGHPHLIAAHTSGTATRATVTARCRNNRFRSYIARFSAPTIAPRYPLSALTATIDPPLASTSSASSRVGLFR